MTRRARYRYRTESLVGPWRVDPAAAFADAVNAGQIRRLTGGEWVWLVPGEFETSFCPDPDDGNSS